MNTLNTFAEMVEFANEEVATLKIDLESLKKQIENLIIDGSDEQSITLEENMGAGKAFLLQVSITRRNHSARIRVLVDQDSFKEFFITGSYGVDGTQRKSFVHQEPQTPNQAFKDTTTFVYDCIFHFARLG